MDFSPYSRRRSNVLNALKAHQDEIAKAEMCLMGLPGRSPEFDRLVWVGERGKICRAFCGDDVPLVELGQVKELIEHAGRIESFVQKTLSYYEVQLNVKSPTAQEKLQEEFDF